MATAMTFVTCICTIHIANFLGIKSRIRLPQISPKQARVPTIMDRLWSMDELFILSVYP